MPRKQPMGAEHGSLRVELIDAMADWIRLRVQLCDKEGNVVMQQERDLLPGETLAIEHLTWQITALIV